MAKIRVVSPQSSVKLGVVNKPANAGIIVNAPKESNALPVMSAPSNANSFGPPPINNQGIGFDPGVANASHLQPSAAPQNAASVGQGVNVQQPGINIPNSGNVRLTNGGASGSWGSATATPVAGQPLAGGGTAQQTVYPNGTIGANGELIPNGPGQVQGSSQNAVTAPLSLDPSATTNTNTLASGITGLDVQSLIQKNLDKQDALLGNITAFFTPSQQEQDLLGEIAQTTKSANDQQVALGTQGILNSVATAQESRAYELAQNKVSYLTNVLNNVQATRKDKLQAAQFLFTANQSNLNQTIDLYSKLAPQSLGVQVNAATGDAYVITRDPVSGKTTSTLAGNVGPGVKTANVQVIGQHYDPQTGQVLNDYGIAYLGADGNLVTKPVSGAQSGLGGGASGLTPTNGTPGMGGTTTSGNTQGNPVQLLMQSIGQYESGGNYSAVNKDTGALGKYQVMPSNVPGWTKEALGQSMTPQQFLASPQAQDSVAQFKMQQYLQQFGNPQGVMGAWIGGPGFASKMSAADANGTTVSKYIGGVSAIYQKLAGEQQAQEAYAQLPGRADLNAIKQQLPPSVSSSLRTTDNGTPYFDGNYLPDTVSIKQAQYYEKVTGIPYVEKDNATKLNHIDVTMQNLTQMSTDVEKILKGGIGGRLYGLTLNPLQHALQSNGTIAAFNSYRDIAINAIQALAAGNGQGFRLNQGEIETAANNLPTIRDNLTTARTKLSLVEGFLNKWNQEILPGNGVNPNGNLTDPLGIR